MVFATGLMIKLDCLQDQKRSKKLNSKMNMVGKHVYHVCQSKWRTWANKKLQ